MEKNIELQGGFMDFSKTFSEAVQFIFAAGARIFSPSDDKYPIIGVQPFEGEPYKGRQWAD